MSIIFQEGKPFVHSDGINLGGKMFKKFVKVFLLLLMVMGVGVSIANVLAAPVNAAGGNEPNMTYYPDFWVCMNSPTDCYVLIIQPR